MKFSIIIPVYNAATTVNKTLQSCIDQTYKDFEVLVVDDASDDNSEAIINEIITQNSEYNIRLITLTQNGGVAVARNTAILQAKGDYIVLLDSDDVFRSEKLQILNNAIERFPNTIMFVNLYDVKPHPINQLQANNIRPINFWSLLFRNKAQGSCICFKNHQNILFNDTFRYCEDMELALRLSYYFECSIIQEYLTILNRPQLTIGGLSGNKWQMRKAEMRIYSRLYQFNWVFVFMIPFLLLFSLLKHIMKLKS